MASIARRELTDGSARYDVIYRDPDGRQRQKTFRKARDASAFASTTEADKLRGQWVDPNAGRVTVRAYGLRWIEDQGFELSTRQAVDSRFKVHVFPTLGRRQLRDVKPSTIQRWLATLGELAPQYQSLIFGNVAAMFTAAVDDELIVKNPCMAKSVRRPRVVRAKVKPWEPATVLRVRDELPSRYRAVATLGLGLRHGESFGLSPDDIDWLRGTVQVRRQVKLIGHRLVLAPPKYGKEREVPLPAAIRDWLAAYLVEFPAHRITLPWRDPAGETRATVPLLVTTRERKAITRTYFNGRVWKPALERAGVEPVRANGTHALRHLYASVLLDAGENIKALSEYLGHADPGFTLRVYTHLMPSSSERTRRAIDEALGGSEVQQESSTTLKTGEKSCDL